MARARARARALARAELALRREAAARASSPADSCGISSTSTGWFGRPPRSPRYGLCSNTTGTLMSCDSVSPGRLITMRMRSRSPSSSLSTCDSTNTTSSIAFANGNAGCVTPSCTFSHGGGEGSLCGRRGGRQGDGGECRHHAEYESQSSS